MIQSVKVNYRNYILQVMTINQLLKYNKDNKYNKSNT